MLVFLNGQFIPEEQATVSVFDRSFSLGDGLFEAIPVYCGKPFLWQKHLDRLQAGAGFLKIDLPFLPDALREFLEELIAKNQADDCVLRIQLSRGVGPRGYSIKGADSPTLVMSLHPTRKLSPSCHVITSSVRIPANDPLTRFKVCSKLPHILARMEADEQGADEALLLNTDGHVAEATSANLFWIESDTICTPPVESGALPGVTRGAVLDLCVKLKIACQERQCPPEQLLRAEGIFLTSIGIEIREVSRLDGEELRRSPITEILRGAYLDYVQSAD